MTNEQLVIRIKAGEDVAGNMERLYMQVKAFIHITAMRYQSMAELEDLEQEGYFALYPAIDGYDPAQGVKFLTYAEYHIRQRIQRYVWRDSGGVRLPHHRMEKVQRYRRLCNAYERAHGREPSDEEAAYCLGIPTEKMQEVKQDDARRHTGSLDSLIKEDDGLTLMDTIPSAESMEEEATEKLYREELRSVLWPEVDALPGQQPLIIRARYQGGMNASQIADYIHADVAAVHREERKALHGLRRPASMVRLRPFFPEEVEAQAYRGSGAESFRRTWTSSTERAALQMQK